MDVIRFGGPTPTEPSLGEFIHGQKSVMWVERYSDASECTITGPIGSDLKTQLPLGSIVSHMDSDVPMIITDHEIDADADTGEPEIVITGKGFETVTNQRLVSADRLYATGWISNTIPHVVDLSPRLSWQYAALLIDRELETGEVNDSGNGIPNVEVWYPDDIYTRISAVGPTPTIINNGKAKFDNVYKQVMDILGYDNLGLSATWRPWVDGVTPKSTMRITITKGIDRSADVVFSHEMGDLGDANYLWSRQSKKTAVMVVGRWISAGSIGSGEAGLDRQWEIVDGSDIDDAFSEEPTGADLTAVVNRMWQRATIAIAGQRETALTQVKPDSISQRYTYRKDYDLGDFVWVEGDYDEARKMMVSEYVEIDDETGESGYPTFAPI